MMTTSATSPSTSMAVRQSYAEIIQRAMGPITEEPRLSPADTRATARLRWAVNQRVVVAVIGTYRLPVATPTSTPKRIWN